MKKNYLLALFSTLLLTYVVNAQNGNALNLDGVDDVVLSGNDSSLQITGNSITIEARIKIDSYAAAYWAGTILSKGKSDGGTGGYGLRAGGTGEISFFFGDGTNWPEVISPNASLSLGTWHHVAGTYDGTNLVLYIDGTAVASAPYTAPISASSDPLRLGNSGFGGRLFDGTLDEIRIWNTVRTQAEISGNMNNELTLPQTGLEAYYQFNQGIGGANNSAEVTLNDALSVNDGVLTNFALNGASSNWVSDSMALSIDEFSSESISLYPNPVKNILNISNLTSTSNYTIYDILGREILKGSTLENNINVENLQSGLHILKLDNLQAIKFIKE